MYLYFALFSIVYSILFYLSIIIVIKACFFISLLRISFLLSQIICSYSSMFLNNIKSCISRHAISNNAYQLMRLLLCPQNFRICLQVSTKLGSFSDYYTLLTNIIIELVNCIRNIAY